MKVITPVTSCSTWLFLLVLQCVFHAAIAQGATCNLEQNPELRVNSLAALSFSQSEIDSQPMEVILPSFVANGSATDNCLRVVGLDEDAQGDIASSSWFTTLQRTGDGFLADITVQISEGISEGIAFVIQNERLFNINGGIGSNFGILNGLSTFVAVTLDFCPNRIDVLTSVTQDVSCEGLVVSVIGKKDGVFLDSKSEAVDSSFLSTNGDKVTFDWGIQFGQDNKYKVFLEDEQVLSETMSFTMVDVLESRFGYVGFTASNSGASPAVFDVKSFSLDLTRSDSKVLDELPKQIEAGLGVFLTVSIRDICDEQATNGAIVSKNITTDSFTGELVHSEIADLISSIETVTDEGDGTFNVFFVLPTGIFANWEVDLYVNGVQTQEMPIKNAIISSVPRVSGLDVMGYGILLFILLLLIVVVVVSIYYYNQYRSKLIEHEEEIDVGKEIEHIHSMEGEMMFQNNDLLFQDAAAGRAVVNQKKEELGMLRKRNGSGADRELEVQRLEEEQVLLKQKVRALKQSEERDKLLDEKVAGAIGPQRSRSKTPKAEFPVDTEIMQTVEEELDQRDATKKMQQLSSTQTGGGDTAEISRLLTEFAQLQNSSSPSNDDVADDAPDDVADERGADDDYLHDI